MAKEIPIKFMKRGEVKRREKVFMEKQSFPEKQTWGTWEELLLACVVHRYGTESWDFVLTELWKRSTSTLHRVLTPHSNKQKYHSQYVSAGAPSSLLDSDADSINSFLNNDRRLKESTLDFKSPS